MSTFVLQAQSGRLLLSHVAVMDLFHYKKLVQLTEKNPSHLPTPLVGT